MEVEGSGNYEDKKDISQTNFDLKRLRLLHSGKYLHKSLWNIVAVLGRKSACVELPLYMWNIEEIYVKHEFKSH